jgi:predicted AAA+ superfamily ATPase
VGRLAHAELLAKGGYPEIQGRAPTRRPRFFESYVEGILERDLVSLGDVADRAVVARLLQAIGATSASELNVDRLSNSLGTPATTLRRHIELLEMLFLIRRVPAWNSNLLARSIKRPKVHVSDTGLLAYLVGADERRIAADLDLGGMFYETFVAMELHRQISWLDDRPDLFHFRDRDQREVDIVIEHRDGSICGVEVKAAATIRAHDFRGLRHLKAKLGNRFKAGAVLYAGANTVPFGDRLAAVPLSGLWTP